MSVFTPAEVAYLTEPRLGRLATADAAGQPHVVPVGFRFDPETGTIAIGGRDIARTKKVRDALANPRAAFLVDDLASTDPWRPRGIEIRGPVEVFEAGGERIRPGFDGTWLRITPRRVVSWGLNTDGFTRDSRTVD